MRDRSLGIILTLIVIFVLGLPGLACLCLGLSSFLLYPIINSQTTLSPAWTSIPGVFGLCIGFFLLLITIVLSYLLLRRRTDTPAVVPAKPTPPPTIDNPAPPTNPDEPLPPTI
jgi:hypothetical protein